MDLVEQHHLNRAFSTVPDAKEMPIAVVAHPLVEHLGCGEQDIGCFCLIGEADKQQYSDKMSEKQGKGLNRAAASRGVVNTW